MSISGSDISSFAEWEALHQPLAKDSERERSLADMARPERVWRDRDSSNDARSSSSGSEDGSLEDEVKLEVREGKGGKGKRREIPSSTAETVSQELGSEFDLPPSSQPRPEESEDEGEDAQEEEIQYGDDDDDDFEDFDIEPSQKEFMKELLAIAPEEEVELLSPPSKKHKHKPSDKVPAPSTKTTKLFKDQPEIKESVQDFASTHPIYDKRKWAEEDVEEYQHDIYQFATAAGLGPHQARVQVMLAVGLWKLSKGLPVIGGEFTKDDERKMEETLSAIGIAKELLAGGKKRKRDEKEVNALDANSSKADDLSTKERKALKKAAKKARRREQMKLKKMQLERRGSDASSSQSAQPAQPPKVNLQSSQSYYAQEASPPLPNSTAGAESKKEKKKRVKPGPTTSPHFSQSQPSPPKPKNNAEKALARLPKSIQEKLELAKQALNGAAEVVEKTVEENKKRKAEDGEVEQEGSKKKRKKNRNKNRLGVDEEDPKPNIEIPGSGKPARTAEDGDVPKKKKRRDRGRKAGGKQESGKVDATAESAAEPMELDNVEYPSTQAAEPIPESVKASILAAQKKARRREKKAKKSEDDSAVQQADSEVIEASNTEPLTELPDTNSKKPKDKKKKKRKHAAENTEVEAHDQGSSENLSKARHS